MALDRPANYGRIPLQTVSRLDQSFSTAFLLSTIENNPRPDLIIMLSVTHFQVLVLLVESWTIQ